MKSKPLAILITFIIMVIVYAIVVAHDVKEAIGIICMIGLGAILIYGVLASMHELIKITRDEE